MPLQVLHSALKSALNATAANIRLTKRGSFPVLCLTITTNSINNMPSNPADDHPGASRGPQDDNDTSIDFTNNSRARETEITQDIPVRVMSPEQVDGIHEPRCREADVFIQLPPLAQLTSAPDKRTRLAAPSASSSGPGPAAASAPGPRLDMAANARGCLRVGVATDAMRMASTWTGLANPGLDPAASGGGGRGGGAAAAAGRRGSRRARGAAGRRGGAERGGVGAGQDRRARVGKGHVGREAGGVEGDCRCVRVASRRAGASCGEADVLVAGFCDDHALILYVFMRSSTKGSTESCLTVSLTSFELLRKDY